MLKCKLAFVGDVMLGDSFYTLGRGVSSSLKKFGEDFLGAGIVNLLKEHDVVFCNLESPASEVGKKKTSLRRMHMRAERSAVKYLKKWGFNVVNLANNHIFEQGTDAAFDTVENLKEQHIDIIGAGIRNTFTGEAEPLEMHIRGTNICLVGLCLLDEKYSYSGGMNLEKTKSILNSNTNKLNIVSLHWGHELMDRPTARQIDMAEELINAGAKMIIGHHPHVLQGLDASKDRIIAYSLGNFIFNGFVKDTKWSCILSVEVNEDLSLVYELYPVVSSKDYRPLLATGSLKKKLLAEINRRSELLKISQEKSAYQKEYTNKISAMRKKLYLKMAGNMFFMSPVFWPQFFFRFIQRRTGTW